MKPAIVWVVGLVVEGKRSKRARSFAVAHAKNGGSFVCGRKMTVRWAGYKKATLAGFRKAASYERRCRNCEHRLSVRSRKRGRRG